MELASKVIRERRCCLDNEFDIGKILSLVELVELLEFIREKLSETVKSTHVVLGKSHEFGDVYVISDLHGCLYSLEVILKHAERMKEESSSNSPLFVICGDVIDRGEHSLEMFLVILIFSVTRNNVIYLKGNHETEEFQCRQPYSEDTLVNQVIRTYFVDKRIYTTSPWWQWNSFVKNDLEKVRSISDPSNEDLRKRYSKYEALFLIFDIFRLLPLTCYLEKERILALHGGLVNQYKTTDEELNLKSDMSLFYSNNPKLNLLSRYHPYEDSVEYQLLWNDVEELGGEVLFGCAQRRTQISVTFTFGQRMTDLFIENTRKNLGVEIDFIIRGHTHFYGDRVIPGYLLNHNGKVVTILSRSDLSGMNNEGGFLIIRDEQVDLYRFLLADSIKKCKECYLFKTLRQRGKSTNRIDGN